MERDVVRSTAEWNSIDDNGASRRSCSSSIINTYRDSGFITAIYLDAKQRQQVGQLLRNYQDIFSTGTYDMGRTNWSSTK